MNQCILKQIAVHRSESKFMFHHNFKVQVNNRPLLIVTCRSEGPASKFKKSKKELTKLSDSNVMDSMQTNQSSKCQSSCKFEMTSPVV